MSTEAIVAIVIAALVLLAIVAYVLPRAKMRSRDREIRRRREEVAGAHRDAAQERMARADRIEREARRERAEAELHESRARLHEEGLADDELDRDRERFVQQDRVIDDDRDRTARDDDRDRFARRGDAEPAEPADTRRDGG